MGIIAELKGRAKEAAGVLSDSKKLQREGKTDRVAGKVKDGIDNVKSKASETLDHAKKAVDKAADSSESKGRE